MLNVERAHLAAGGEHVEDVSAFHGRVRRLKEIGEIERGDQQRIAAPCGPFCAERCSSSAPRLRPVTTTTRSAGSRAPAARAAAMTSAARSADGSTAKPVGPTSSARCRRNIVGGSTRGIARRSRWCTSSRLAPARSSRRSAVAPSICPPRRARTRLHDAGKHAHHHLMAELGGEFARGNGASRSITALSWLP